MLLETTWQDLRLQADLVNVIHSLVHSLWLISSILALEEIEKLLRVLQENIEKKTLPARGKTKGLQRLGCVVDSCCDQQYSRL